MLHFGWKLARPGNGQKRASKYYWTDAPNARLYFSDGVEAYGQLWYHYGRHVVSDRKTDTISVKIDKAEFYHYFAWLARLSR